MSKDRDTRFSDETSVGKLAEIYGDSSSLSNIDKRNMCVLFIQEGLTKGLWQDEIDEVKKIASENPNGPLQQVLDDHKMTLENFIKISLSATNYMKRVCRVPSSNSIHPLNSPK